MPNESPTPARGGWRLPAPVRVPLVLLAATALALLGAELLVRALGLAPPPRGENKALRVVCRGAGADRAGAGRILVPGAEETHVYPGAGGEPDRAVVYRINALGLRGPERSLEKPPGVFRICALGDSFTFGTAIPYEDTWPAALERELAERAPGAAWEVLNCGMEAVNLPQEVALLEARVAPLQPDLVVLCVYLNDASGRGIESADLSPEARRRVEWISRLGLTSGVWARGEAVTGAQRRTMALRRVSELADWLGYRAYLALYGPITVENYRRDWSEGSPGWKAARAALARISETAERDGFDLVVAMYPVLAGLEGDYPFRQEHARVGAACAELGVPFVDLAEVLAGRPSRELHAHAHDAHPNGGANAAVAERLADAVLALAGR